MRTFTLISTIFWTFCIQAQINDFKYDRIPLTKGAEVIKAMELSPDGSEIAISTYAGKLRFFSSDSYTELRSFKIGDFNHGARIYYSTSGRYIILKRLRLADWNSNKDGKLMIGIIDTQSGDMIVKKDGILDMALSPNEDTYSYIDAGKLVVCSFPDGKEISSHSDSRLQSSICYGPNGDVIYASRGFDKSDLKKDPRFKKNKKGAKSFSKYQQTIVGYSATDLSQTFITGENFDEIYDMELSSKKDRLLISAKQDAKINAITTTFFVLQMELGSGRLLREQFNSTVAEADFKENISKDLFGIVTNEHMDNSHSVMLYDASTNAVVAKFDVDTRFLEILQMDASQDGSAHFDFSKDERYLLTAIGNTLFKWKIKLED